MNHASKNLGNVTFFMKVVAKSSPRFLEFFAFWISYLVT